MAIPRKTLRDIKTLSGRVDRIANPYMAYMQVTCLEMEKARRGRERESALQRLAILNTRLQEIEIEEASLLRALSERGSHPAPGTSPPGGRPASGENRSRFRLRY